jgi:hypothetical protein
MRFHIRLFRNKKRGDNILLPPLAFRVSQKGKTFKKSRSNYE